MNRGPGQRAGLTKDAVLAQARTLLADGGLAALSMRALARALQVAPNALYSHVADKTELVDALLDDALAAVHSPGPGGDPVDGLAAMMTSTYEVLTAHADLVPVFLARQGARGPNAVRLGEVMDLLLARASVPPSAVPEARRVLIVHAIGSAAFAAGGAVVPAAESTASFARSLRWLLAGITQEPPGTHPG